MTKKGLDAILAGVADTMTQAKSAKRQAVAAARPSERPIIVKTPAGISHKVRRRRIRGVGGPHKGVVVLFLHGARPLTITERSAKAHRLI